MPRLAKITLMFCAILLILAGIVVGIITALIHSEAGTRWLTSQATHWTDGVAEWREVSGPLTGPLQLSGVYIRQPGMDMSLESLSLDWQPLALLQGQFKVDGVSAEGVRINLTVTPDQSAAPVEPFNPVDLKLPLGVSLQGVRLRNIRIIQGDQPAQLINSIELDVKLVNGKLGIQQLAVMLPEGDLLITGSSVLHNPMPLDLQLEWQWRLPPEPPSLTSNAPKDGALLEGTFALQGELQWGEAIGFQLVYDSNTAGLEHVNVDLPAQLAASGELRGEYNGDTLNLSEMNLALAGMALGLKGEVALPEGGDPSFDLVLRWADLQWPLSADEPDVDSAEGSLALAGSVSAYSLQLALDLAGKDIPPSHWSGEGSGDASHLELRQLNGSVLGGELHISGPVQWQPFPRWQLRIEASDLDPSQFNADIPGQLAIALTTSGTFDSGKGIQATIDLQKFTGTLMAYELDLVAQASVLGEQLQLDNLRMQSMGNQLNASGLLSAEELTLDWQLLAPNPGAFFTGASGVLKGSGNVAGSVESPRMRAQLKVQDLELEALYIPTMKADLQLGLAANDILNIDVVVGAVESEGQPLLHSLNLWVKGTTSKHKLAVSLATQSEQLKLGMRGGVNQSLDTWQGELTQFSGISDDYGSWLLSAASALTLSEDSLSLANSCLKNEGTTAKVCARGSWASSGESMLKAEIQAFPVSIATTVITGDISGQIEASIASGGAVDALAAFNMTPGLVTVELEQGEKKLSHGGGSIDLNVSRKGLVGKLDFVAPEQGSVSASIRLPALNTWPLSEEQPVSGKVKASLPDLSIVTTWVKELANTAGQLGADLTLGGTLDKPKFLGEVSLKDGVADIPIAGLKLRQIELHALSDPLNSELLALDGSMASGKGRMDLSGQLSIVDSTVSLALRGELFQVYNTKDARVVLSPDLDIGWSDETLKLRGKLIIPSADITPQLSISPAVASEDQGVVQGSVQIIGPSPDVVVINAPEGRAQTAVQLAAPFLIDSQIQLIIGDDVNVNTLGFVSDISGAVMFTNAPDRDELIPMARGKISLDDGTFRAFGQDLIIETGQLIFADVPATEPELNVRAVRWINNDPEVTAAGVLVTGSVTEPVLEMFSRPQLDPSEVQSYLLTGRSSGDKTNVLSIGTYVSPRIYVGYGYNLIEKTNEFNSLFNITPRYGVGANLGEFDNNINMTITFEN